MSKAPTLDVETGDLEKTGSSFIQETRSPRSGSPRKSPTAGSPAVMLAASALSPQYSKEGPVRMSSHEREQWAVMKIKAYWNKVQMRKKKIPRAQLIDRLEMEHDLASGIFQMLSWTLIFACLVLPVFFAGNVTWEWDFRTLVETQLDLNEKLPQISNVPQIREYLTELSANTKVFAPGSDSYFHTESAQKLLSGITQFENTHHFQAASLEPRVGLTESFTLTAWVHTPATMSAEDGRTALIRKPLGRSAEQLPFNCWAWYHPPELQFGAHDTNWLDKDMHVVVAPDLVIEPGFHLEALVVNTTHATFYRDAKQLSAPMLLPRPVTDCGGSDFFEVGAPGMKFGELVVWPKALPLQQLRELMEYGSPLTSVALGSSLFQPKENVVDQVLSTSTMNSAALRSDIKRLKDQGEAGFLLDTKVVPALKGTYPSFTVHANMTTGMKLPRRYMADPVLHSADEVLGLPYYDMLPGQNITRIYNPPFQSWATHPWLSWNPATLPPWQPGTSVSITFWLDERGLHKSKNWLYLIAVMKDMDGSVCNSFEYSPEPLKLGGRSSGMPYAGTRRRRRSFANGVKSPAPGEAEVNQANPMPRFVGVVYDQENNFVDYYIDGERIIHEDYGNSSYSRAQGANITKYAECWGSTPYVGFAHRAAVPGYAMPIDADIQQMYFWKEALTPAQIKKLHDESRSLALGRQPLKQCRDLSKMTDTTYTDVWGNRCADYQEKRLQGLPICDNPKAKDQCPIACQSVNMCWEGYRNNGLRGKIFSAVQRIKPTYWNTTFCLRRGIDVNHIVNECKQRNASNSSYTTKTFPNRRRRYGSMVRKIIEDSPNNCEDLRLAVNPHCTFDWPANITDMGGLTMAMWLKPTRPWHSGYSTAMFIKRHWATQDLIIGMDPASGGAGSSMWYEYNQYNKDLERVHGEDLGATTQEPFVDDAWKFGVLSFEDRLVRGLHDSQGVEEPLAQSANMSWLLSDGGPKMIEFRTFDGLVGPIMVQPGLMPTGEMQQLFYESRPNMTLRRGPKIDETQRIRAKEKYKFSRPALSSFLAVPPMILQARAAPSASCDVDYSNMFLKQTLDIVRHDLCVAPFKCDADLLRRDDSFIACRVDAAYDAVHFGRTTCKHDACESLDSHPLFEEFLYTVVDNPLIVRNGDVFETEEFVDAMSRGVIVLAIFYSPEIGTTSLLEIRFDKDGDARVKPSYKLEHFTALPQSRVNSIVIFCSVLITICVLTLVDVWFLFKAEGVDHSHISDASNRSVLIVNVMLCACTVFYGVWLMTQSVGSSSELSSIMEPLVGVPWADAGMSLADKYNRFHGSLQALLTHINSKKIQDKLGKVLLMLVLSRLVLTTAHHPRMAVMVKMLIHAWNDLIHFLMIWCVISVGYCCLAFLSFGQSRERFSTFAKAFETQFGMMLGEVPENWTDEWLFAVYILTYNVLVFCLMLNFLIGIVVDSYTTVTKDLDDNVTEQSFVIDLIEIIYAKVRYTIMRWPGPKKIADHIRTLKCRQRLDYNDLCRSGLFHTESSAQKFIEYYAKYSFMQDPGPLKLKDVPGLADEVASMNKFAEVIPRIHARKQKAMTLKKERAPDFECIKQLRDEMVDLKKEVATATNTNLELSKKYDNQARAHEGVSRMLQSI